MSKNNNKIFWFIVLDFSSLLLASSSESLLPSLSTDQTSRSFLFVLARLRYWRCRKHPLSPFVNMMAANTTADTMAANIATNMINNAMPTMQSPQSNVSQEMLHKRIRPPSFTILDGQLRSRTFHRSAHLHFTAMRVARLLKS